MADCGGDLQRGRSLSTVDREVGYLLRKLNDPNIRFPRYPRLIPDIDVFLMPDELGVQFHGSDTPVIIRGRGANELLHHLLPALDGKHTLPELLTSLSSYLTESAVLKTLSLLHERGLLDDGAIAEEPILTSDGRDSILHRQSLFWGRSLGITRSAQSPGEVQRRLRDARVVLIGTGLFGALTFDLLSRSGCEKMRAIAWNDEDRFFARA